VTDLLPPFPVDDVTLATIEHALGGAWDVDEEGNHTLVGAEFTFDRVLDFMAGIDVNDRSQVEQIDDSNVYIDHRPHYHPNDVIRALIAEVRRLREQQP
jgi:hypothetical protein